MRAAIAISASSPIALRSKVVLTPCRRNVAYHSCLPSLRSHQVQLSTRCSVKASSAEHFGQASKVVSFLNNLSHSLHGVPQESLKEFPWDKARFILVERILFLGQKVLKWSFIVLFGISFISDVSLAVLRNRELLIPLGLFAGVTLAEFLKESSRELFRSSGKAEDIFKQLLGIGSVFLLVKFVSLYLRIQGKVLLSHVGNGGLLQVLWLVKEMQQTKQAERAEEQVVDAPISSSFCHGCR